MSAPALVRKTLAIALLFAASGSASDLDDRLNQRLRGAWAILEVEVFSACAGTYNDNQVSDAGVASKAPQRFEAGELVKIDKVNAKRQRVDLLLSLAVPLRISHEEGPFELYDEKKCQVQLIVPFARTDIKSGNVSAITARLEELIDLYPSLDDARQSDAWNGREMQSLPADYDQTLQLHAAWKAEQTNAAVAEALHRAISDAADVSDDLRDDPDYIAGFGAGAEEMSSFKMTDCSSLLSASLYYHDTSPPKDKPKAWRDGWEDGQEVIFNVLLANGLQACRVPVPSTP